MGHYFPKRIKSQISIKDIPQSIKKSLSEKMQDPQNKYSAFPNIYELQLHSKHHLNDGILNIKIKQSL